MDDQERKFYDLFRTGLTWREVSEMVWSHDEDPRTWPKGSATRRVGKKKDKDGKAVMVGGRRHTVLGKWRQIKQEMWAHAINQSGGLDAYIEWFEGYQKAAVNG